VNERTNLGTAFHETFSLSRPSLCEVIRVTAEMATGPDAVSFSSLRMHTHLGTNLIRSARRYAFGTGLTTADGRLSRFGELVVANDPNLADAATQWLLHYHMSAGHHAGPAYWHHLVTRRMIPGNVLDLGALATEIGILVEREEGRPIAPGTLRSSATVFVGSYRKPDGLGGLGFVSGPERGPFEVRTPSSVPRAAFAYALCDYWENVLDSLSTIHLRDLTDGGRFPELFGLGPDSVMGSLRELQGAGLIQIQRVASPYQVYRLWPSAAEMLERVYGP